MNERQQNILRLLVESNDFLPASYFSKKLNVSTKTIYKDLAIIELELLNKKVALYKKQSKGIKLEGKKEDITNFVREMFQLETSETFSPLYRRIGLVNHILLNNNSVTLEELSTQYIVSKASIYKDIEYINNILPGDKIIIESDTEGLTSIGEENEIQSSIKQIIEYFLYRDDRIDLFYERLKYFFSPTLINSVKTVIDKYYFNLEGGAPKYYINSLTVVLLVLCQRSLIGQKIIQEDDFLFNTVRFMETYVISNDILDDLSKKVQLSFSNYDREYLSKQLFAHRMSVDSVNQQTVSYEEEVIDLVHRMSMIHKTDLTKNNRLLKALNNHIPAMILRLKKNIKIVNPLLEEIKTQYSELFSIVWYALNNIEKKHSVIINDDEISLVLIHFQIALDAQYKSNNILIVCQYGVSSAEFIFNKVRKFLPAYDNIEIATIDKFYKNSQENIDLIISSIDLKVKDIPYVKVNPLVKKEDYVNIMQAYTQYIIQKEEVLDDGTNKLGSILEKYISEDLIFLNSAYDNKESVLNGIISELEKMNYVKKDYRKSVFNREEIGSTNIDTKVALPHANPSTINKSHIVYMTLKKPINWGNINVRLIIMVNLQEEDISEVREVISELYKRIDTDEKVKIICKSNNKKEFIKYMFN